MPTVHHANCELYYERHGTPGKPGLVFAHGAGGNAMSWWQQVPAFADRYDIVTFDHRGFGKSACAAADFDMNLLGEDLRAILDDAGLSSATVVCQSMGGWSGVLLAARHPSRVERLVLCNTPGAIVTDEVAAQRRRVAGLLREPGGLIGKAIARETAERDPALAFLYAEIAARNPERPDLATQSATVSDAEIAAISAPVYMITSELDVLFPPEVLTSVARKVGARAVRHVQGCGHSTYFEKAGEFNAILAEFLAG